MHFFLYNTNIRTDTQTDTFTLTQTHKQIISPRLQVTNMDRIERINAHNTWFQVQMCFLGVSTTVNYF